MKDQHPSVKKPESSRTADLPPGMDAPSPERERQRIAAGQGAATDAIEGDIRRLANQVGGMTRLRELVTELERADR